jgi:hypothetical protein
LAPAFTENRPAFCTPTRRNLPPTVPSDADRARPNRLPLSPIIEGEEKEEEGDERITEKRGYGLIVSIPEGKQSIAI